MSGQFEPEHLEQLKAAKHALENVSIATRISDVIGTPIEKAIDRLPAAWQEKIVGISREALETAAGIAIWTIDSENLLPSQDLVHKVAASASGAAGGAFGLPALAIELPVSTTIMIRSVADIARSEGEDIRAPETKLQCVEVFALGGRTEGDDAAESGYYIVRTALARTVSEATNFLVKGGTDIAAPALIRFMTQVAARFQIQVTQKAAAQAVPIIGAAGGALINNLFISHFQNTARAHFSVRRLERHYSPEIVKAAYDDL